MEVYDFGLRLKKLRKACQLSQDQVASKLDLTRSTISAYERNIKTPKLDALVKLAIMYNTSLDYIMGLNNRPNIYIDDLTDSQQKTVQDIIGRLRQEFSGNRA